MKLYIQITTLILFFNVNICSQTTVGGIISSNTTWTLSGSPYIVVDNILVENGVELTIEPGVTVKLDSAKVLLIQGSLIAKGTSSSEIIFTSNQAVPHTGDWGYILFDDTSTDAEFDLNGNYIDGCILEFTTIEYGGGVGERGVVWIISSYPFINFATIRQNSASGIYAEELLDSLDLKITNSLIENNIAALHPYPGSSLTTADGGGIYISAKRSIISHNRIYNNLAPLSQLKSDGGGIYIEGGVNNFV